MIKEEIRIIGWDDCSHAGGEKSVLAVGVIFRGGKFIDGMLSTKIRKDGMDATEKLAQSICVSRHFDQLSVIMLNGITMAGFNVIDIRALSKKTKLPVMAILRRKPDRKRFFEALKNLRQYKQRLAMAKRAGRFHGYGNVFYQKSGINEEDCRKILDVSSLHGNIPEPVRVAHLIASGLSGESRGRA